MNARFENFTISILRLYKLIQKIKMREIEHLDLRPIHIMCIYYLDKYGDGLTAGDLVRLTLDDKAAISRALSSMRDSGYIEYNTRSYNSKATLTEKGRSFARFIDERTSLAVDAVDGGLSPEDTETMYRALGIITAKLEEYYDTLQKSD